MTDWKDTRPKQDSLIKRPGRADPETRIDRGSSDEFADDRDSETQERDPGEQSRLAYEPVDDGDQLDLSGERAAERPEWSEGR